MMYKKKFPAVMLACTLSVAMLAAGITCAEDVSGQQEMYEGTDPAQVFPEDMPMPPQAETGEVPQENWQEVPLEENAADVWQQDQMEPLYDEQGNVIGSGQEQTTETPAERPADRADTEVETPRDIRNFASEFPGVEDFEIFGKEEAMEAFAITAKTELPSYMYLNVPEVLQKPELPTGCESVALTMALMYEGFDLQKTTIAREFLIYNRENDNAALGYIGDPFSEEGAGCFAPAVAATAMDFFKDQGYNYTAYDITGSSMDQLLLYVSKGTPVIVWTTMYMMEPEFTRDDAVYKDKVYQWYKQEHCVVISGYDTASKTLQINDPLEGIIMRDWAEFERLYNLTGQNAVVLKYNMALENLAPAQERESETSSVNTGVQ